MSLLKMQICYVEIYMEENAVLRGNSHEKASLGLHECHFSASSPDALNGDMQLHTHYHPRIRLKFIWRHSMSIPITGIRLLQKEPCLHYSLCSGSMTEDS